MPRPTLIFRHSAQLVAALEARDWEKDLSGLHEKDPDLGPLTAVHASVGKSSLRRFRKNRDWTPSIVFRSWASTELLDGSLVELAKVSDNDQYRKWAVSHAKGLIRAWKKRFPKYPMDIPIALKLINLLAKRLCVVFPLWPEKYKRVIWFVDVPLDKYSLRPLACMPELAHLTINWNTASMGSVKDVETYVEIQDAIRNICRKAHVPPLAYDFLVWDSPHGEG